MWISNRAGPTGVVVLAGFLALAPTRPTPSMVLTISPAAHSYGQVVVRASGASFNFNVTLPPGGGPRDSVVVGFTGPNAGDFRVNQYLFNPNGAARSSSCTDSTATWRTGSCDVWVEFIPQAPGVRNATLVISDTRGNRGTASLTGTGLFGCQPVLVSCNYAANYSGTFTWSSTLNIQQGTTSGPNHRGDQTYDVTVQVINGVATCQGSSSETMNDLEGTRLDGSKKSSGVRSGPGLFAVEFKKSGGQSVYEITAACPSAFITETYTDHIANQTSTTTSKPKPADWRDRISIEPQPAGPLGSNLSGSKTIRNPDEDPPNGVTGTMTFTWALKIS